MTRMNWMIRVTRKTGMTEITKMTITGTTRMTGMTRVTGITGMTRVTRMTGMTRVTRVTGMTKVTGITGIAAKQALYEPNKANAAFYVKRETRDEKNEVSVTSPLLWLFPPSLHEHCIRIG